jgi:uncharacterized PurR-regulated membrane protein YhhQ (DUF165 family)
LVELLKIQIHSYQVKKNHLCQAFGLALAKYIFKVFIALIDTIFIYAIKDWQVTK